jgi:hypothetical protein
LKWTLWATLRTKETAGRSVVGHDSTAGIMEI